MLKYLNVFLLVFFIGCSKSSENIFDASVEPITKGSWYKPDINASWQWQLAISEGSDLNTSYDVEIYDIDLFDTSVETIAILHESGKKVICYFSAGSYEDWRDDASDFPSATKGSKMSGWDEELWLDISNESLAPIMQARLDLAKAKGCDGVEPDNMDGYTNSTGFALSADNQLGYNKFIANEARSRGLSVALKNDLDQIVELEPYFDFAVNEQCFMLNECTLLQPFTDVYKPVLNAEYDDIYQNNTAGARDIMCAESDALKFRTLVLPIDLDGSSRFSCQ